MSPSRSTPRTTTAATVVRARARAAGRARAGPASSLARAPPRAGSGRAAAGKLSLKNLRLHLEAVYGPERVERLFEDIGWIIVHSLKAAQSVVLNDRHCFEMYGYDILMDSRLKPWLLEVNASPSLSASTESDRVLKHGLISDVLDIVAPADFLEAGRGPRPPDADEGAGGHAAGGGEERGPNNFELLYDEGVELEAKRVRRDGEARRAGHKGAGTKPGVRTSVFR